MISIDNYLSGYNTNRIIELRVKERIITDFKLQNYLNKRLSNKIYKSLGKI